MDEQLIGGMIASAFCLVVYAVMAAGVGALAHWRMRRAEAGLGRRALPEHEAPLLIYAGASTVWVAAAVIAVVGLANKKWARLGRDATFIFLGHIGLAHLAAVAQVINDAGGGRQSPLGIVVGAAIIVAGSAVLACVFAWRWAGARAARLADAEPTDAEPLGPERYGIYALAALFWPVGLLAPLLLTKPEQVWTGSIAMRCSLVNLLAIALLTCAGLIGVALYVL